MPLREKVETIAREIYGASGVDFTPGAAKKLADYEAFGYGCLPICMAKTQYSLSADAALKGRPTGFALPIRDVRLSAGRGSSPHCTATCARCRGSRPDLPATRSTSTRTGTLSSCSDREARMKRLAAFLAGAVLVAASLATASLATAALSVSAAASTPGPAGAHGALAAPRTAVPRVASAALPAPVPCRGCWKPEVGSSWQIQLTGRVDLSVKAAVYDVDLFDTPASTVAKLHSLKRHVVCYMSAGSLEEWRPDAVRFPPEVIGRPLQGWSDERWLDIRRVDVLAPVMRSRLDLCRSKGFDAVDPDNVDGWVNDTGFALTADDEARFVAWLANEAHGRGLAVTLKNDLQQAPRLVGYVDAAVVEQCFVYSECDLARPFVAAHKPVWEIEYALAPAAFCARARALGFDALRKELDLGAWRVPCGHARRPRG